MFPHKVTPLFTKRIFSPVICAHTKSCPVGGKRKAPAGDSGGSSSSVTGIVRQPTSDKVRLGFLPENWFTFFHSITGVTGPYVLLIVSANYCFSKEIYVMEHEYYLGLSAFVMLTYTIKTFGKDCADYLDGEVEKVSQELQQGRKNEIAYWRDVIKTRTDAQQSATAQKLLMEAKKENVALQLEAIARERAMMVYFMVRGRMEYQMKRHQALNRIHQKWMLAWILQKVRASITPEFEKEALNSAIRDLSAAAQQANK